MSDLWGFTDAVHSAVMQERSLGIVANNLANVNNAGYKADRLIFNDLMTQQVKVDHRQGNLKITGNSLDVALEGDGFFQVRTKRGVMLTRNGNFTMRPDGGIVTQAGDPVLGDGGPLTINPNGPKVNIDPQGAIFQGDNQVGQLKVVQVKDKENLEKAGYNHFTGLRGKQPQTTKATDYGISQGTLEMANVEVVRQMVGMINAHRAFESYTKAVQAMANMDNKAATQVGRVG